MKYDITKLDDLGPMQSHIPFIATVTTQTMKNNLKFSFYNKRTLMHFLFKFNWNIIDMRSKRHESREFN